MIRFDTRDTKPKLYNIAILTVITALIIMVLALIDKEGTKIIVSSLLIAYCVVVIYMLQHAFAEQLRYNPYSYNTIYYFGFSLFIAFILLIYVGLLIDQIREPDIYNANQSILVVYESARAFMFYTSPFILVFSICLCVSNISLIRHEGYRPVNLLGILLSLFLILGNIFLWWFDYFVSGSQFEVMIHDMVANLLAAVYLYVECMLIGIIVADLFAARYWPDYDKDFMIILGCGIRQDGTPTPLLRGRVDKALEFARRQKEATGKDLIFVPSGGQGPNEVISESESMKNYLLSKGIPEERILMEDQSTTTFENMKFSKEKIMAIDPNAKIAYSTTNYHVFRSGLFARRVKMRAQGIGARTKWYFWPNAAVREFVGLLTQHRGKQILILSSMILLYLTLTFVVFMA